MRLQIVPILLAAALGGAVGAGVTTWLHQTTNAPLAAALHDGRPNQQALKTALAKLQSQLEIGLNVSDMATSLAEVQTNLTLSTLDLSTDQRVRTETVLATGKAVIELWRDTLRKGCPADCQSEMTERLRQLGIFKSNDDWITTFGKFGFTIGLAAETISSQRYWPL